LAINIDIIQMADRAIRRKRTKFCQTAFCVTARSYRLERSETVPSANDTDTSLLALRRIRKTHFCTSIWNHFDSRHPSFIWTNIIV